MIKKTLAVLCLSIASTTAVQAAAITWGAGQDNGFSNNAAGELAQGMLARLGYFNITDAEILQNQLNLAFLDSHFTLIDTARIGDGLGGAPSNFATAKDSLDTSAVAGQQMYYWVFRSTNNSTAATSFSTATEHGIFYMDKAIDIDWAFPVQDPVPGSTNTDISDLTNAVGTALIAGAHVVVGDFPKGSSVIGGGAPNFGLTVVPEPSSALLLGAGALGLLARRRRNS